MANELVLNKDVIASIKRRLMVFQEESQRLLRLSESAILSAEQEGWSDSSYIHFQDMFDSANVGIKDGLRTVEEELIPYLKKLEQQIEDF